MVEAILTGLTGGGSGFLGSIASRFMGIFEAREKTKMLKVEHEHELKLLELQQREASEEREHEFAIVNTQAQTQTLNASYQHDSQYAVQVPNRALRNAELMREGVRNGLI